MAASLLARLCFGCPPKAPDSRDRISSLNAQGEEITSNPLYARDYFSTPPAGVYREVSVSQFAKDVWCDEKAIAASPFQVKKFDLVWLLPLAATTGVLIGTDRHVMTLIHSDPGNRNRSTLLSDAGLAAFGAATLVSYGIGAITQDEHARETGLLSIESLADSFLLAGAMKFLSDRQSPDTAWGHGLFSHSSPLRSSFPSEPAALAWSAATVFTQEYPGPLMQWGAYGLASAVSLSQVTADKHFPSDILIGAVTGYLMGRFVYRAHHDDRMTDRTGSTPVSTRLAKAMVPSTPPEGRHHSPPADGSPYVPRDSWIYPALQRLAALGFIRDQVSDLAPWTRAECLHQTEEAADLASTRESTERESALNAEAMKLIAGLQTELGGETSGNGTVRLESLYTRVTGISGTPLRDSYHLGQTTSDDFGRPYDSGFNNITGFSSYAAQGPFFAYFRGEYQDAPGRPADSLAVREFIADADGNPVSGPKPVTATNGFQPLEMYAGVKLGFENITFGKQDLWWGPGEASAFSFSNNAEPFYLLRFAQARPIVLPGILSYLGKIRTEIIFGKLSGHQWPSRPYVNAQKISLDLTDNFELGFTRSAFFGGVGHPLTLGNFESSLFSVNSQDYGPYGSPNNPGDRHSGFDFRYRVPGLRRYVTVYSDSYADDDPSPLDNPKRSAWAPGLYLSQIPGLRKLDFRLETYSTLLYRKDQGGKFFYWDGQYHDSYTNDGYLLGSWVGRDSRAYDVSTTYWFSARSQLRAEYRQIKAGNAFLPGGGTQTDASMTAQWSLTPEWMITAKAQYERYDLPILAGPQEDLLGSLTVMFTPLKWRR